MSIEHMDNFVAYGLGGQARLTNGVYAEAGDVALVADPDGVSTTPVLECTRSFSPRSFLRYVLSTPVNTAGVAYRFWANDLPNKAASDFTMFNFKTNTNTPICYGYLNTVGGIDVFNASGVLIGSTPGAVITANGWFHIEVKCVRNNVAGTLEIRVEGVPVLTLTGLNLGTTDIAQVSWSRYNADNISFYLKDVVIWNGLGSILNDFLGSVTVFTMLPNADTTLGGWTSTNANGWSVLDNAPPLDTTEFLTAGLTPVTACQFGLSNLPSTATSVRALMTMVRAQKVDGGDGNLQVSLVSGAFTDPGANRPITAAMTYWRDVSELDPATASPWTLAGANAAQLKLDRTL